MSAAIIADTFFMGKTSKTGIAHHVLGIMALLIASATIIFAVFALVNISTSESATDVSLAVFELFFVLIALFFAIISLFGWRWINDTIDRRIERGIDTKIKDRYYSLESRIKKLETDTKHQQNIDSANKVTSNG